MRNRGRFAAKAAGVFAAMALMVCLMGPAGAAEIDVSFLLEDGSEITTPGQVLPLFDPDNPMSSGIVGVWDDTTGDLTADLEIAPRQSQECVASGGTFGILTSTTTYDASEVVGNIDPVTGDAELSTDVDVSIDIPNTPPTASSGRAKMKTSGRPRPRRKAPTASAARAAKFIIIPQKAGKKSRFGTWCSRSSTAWAIRRTTSARYPKRTSTPAWAWNAPPLFCKASAAILRSTF
jgi:hypothetical protein